MIKVGTDTFFEDSSLVHSQTCSPTPFPPPASHKIRLDSFPFPTLIFVTHSSRLSRGKTTPILFFLAHDVLHSFFFQVLLSVYASCLYRTMVQPRFEARSGNLENRHQSESTKDFTSKLLSFASRRFFIWNPSVGISSSLLAWRLNSRWRSIEYQ